MQSLSVSPSGVAMFLFFLLLLQCVLLLRSEITSPVLSECFTVNGGDYRGTISHAGPEGIPCLYWNQTTQHLYNTQSHPNKELGLGNHNYCRNPDADVQPWCYVSENEEGVYWKYCDIPTCHMPGYLGCFLDFGSPPALSGEGGTSSKLTVQTCIRYCRKKGYQYAGLEAGYACFCGDASDKATLQSVSDSQCDQACFGKPTELCGGDGTLSVYSAWVGACHWNFSSVSGVLYSPDFPEDYGSGRECSWDIRPPDSVSVELKFHSFQVPDPNDVLELRDGISGHILAQIPGGQEAPSTITVSTGHLQIKFQSDQMLSGPGYAITYQGLRAPDAVASSDRTEQSENVISKKVWILIVTGVCLLTVCVGYLIWRFSLWSWGASGPGPGVQPSCSVLYKPGCRGHLTCANQSSMKSLL
ncbi:kremen protein 2 [Discoglossus pictus]